MQASGVKFLSDKGFGRAIAVGSEGSDRKLMERSVSEPDSADDQDERATFREVQSMNNGRK